MADYPTGIYSPRTKENRAGVIYTPAKTTVGYAEDVSLLDDEVVAIETELGANPKGGHDSVADRFNDDEAVMVTLTGAETLTNKRKKPRVYTTTDISGTPGVLTPEINTYDYFEITAQAHALNIANKSTSTPAGGEVMIIAITSDATPRALTYGTDYVAKGGVALPSTTVASKTTTLGFKWNAGLGKWNLLAVAQEA